MSSSVCRYKRSEADAALLLSPSVKNWLRQLCVTAKASASPPQHQQPSMIRTDLQLSECTPAGEFLFHAVSSNTHQATTPNPDLQQGLRALSRDAAPADGVLTLPGITSELQQRQFMFAVAVQDGARERATLLQQMRQAKYSLLRAARTGKTSIAAHVAAVDGSHTCLE